MTKCRNCGTKENITTCYAKGEGRYDYYCSGCFFKVFKKPLSEKESNKILKQVKKQIESDRRAMRDNECLKP